MNSTAVTSTENKVGLKANRGLQANQAGPPCGTVVSPVMDPGEHLSETRRHGKCRAVVESSPYFRDVESSLRHPTSTRMILETQWDRGDVGRTQRAVCHGPVTE